MLAVVAQVERDDLGWAQAVVSLKRAAGPRGAELLALALNAVAGADALLPHGALVMRDEPAVGRPGNKSAGPASLRGMPAHTARSGSAG